MDANGIENPNSGTRTFTQEELDAIVGDRLARERKKYEDYDSLKQKAGEYDKWKEGEKSELQKANERADDLQRQLDALNKTNSVRTAREKVSKELNIPAELLTGEDEETCKKQAEAILKFAKPKEYPGTQKNNSKQGNQGSSSTDDSMRNLARQIFKKGE